MKFKLSLYAYLFIHFFRQVFYLKCEISSIDWSFLKHLSKLEIVKKYFYKKSVFSVQFNLKSIHLEKYLIEPIEKFVLSIKRWSVSLLFS